MKGFTPILLVLLCLVTCLVNLKSQTLDKQADISEYLEMSLEDLLNLQVSVKVASTKGDNIFVSPSTVSIISKDQIEKYNFTSVEEALQSLAGVKVYRTYLKRNLPTTRGIIQDHYANKTLILINGIPLWNAVTGEGNLDRINIYDIERIEVLKGPSSVLYGTNAYSGTINLVLKREELNTGTAYGGFGNNGSYKAGTNLFLKKENLETYISLNSGVEQGPERNWTDEQNITRPISDQLKSDNITLNSRYKMHSVVVNGYQQLESYYGVTPSFKAGAGIDQGLKGYCANYTYDKIFANRVGFVGGATYDYNMRDLARDSIDFMRSRIDGSRLRFDMRGSYSFWKDLLLAEVGADYAFSKCLNYSNYIVASDSVVDYSNLNNKKIAESSIFGQIQFVKNHFKAVFGSRFTSNELFGTNISSRATLVYSIDAKSSVKIIYGESYRAPSLFETYFYQEASPLKTVFGNTNLKPEKSNSIEIAYLKSFNNFLFQALIYRGAYQNKIYRSTSDTTLVTPTGKTLGYYTTATNSPSIYVNGNEFMAKGVELEVQYSNPQALTAFVNYNFLNGNKGDSVTVYDKSDNAILAYNFRFVSNHTLSVGGSKNLLRIVTVSGVYNFMTSMSGAFDAIQNQQSVDVNIGIKHRVGKCRVVHLLSMKNIMDENLQYPEYARMNSVVNSIPYGTYRFIGYTLKVII